MVMHFSPRQLEAFITAAELQNFRQAALRLHLTPSAVSNLISELEASVGFSLFERTTRKVSLTSGGRRFLPSAAAVLRQMESAYSTADDISRSERDVVRVAAPLVIAAVLLPRLIAERPDHERYSVRIIDTPVVWLGDRVATGEADMALGPDRTVAQQVRCTDLYATPWVLWCRPDHILARSEEVKWRDLQNFDVAAAGRDHEQVVWPKLAQAGIAPVPNQVQIVDNMSTSLGMAAQGLCVTFSPDYVSPLAQLLGLVKRPLAEPAVSRRLCLFEPQAGVSPASRTFRNFLAQSQPLKSG